MELTWSFIIWPSICICLSVALFLQLFRGKPRSSSERLPPGPPKWPVVGNMFDLGEAPHQTMAVLAKTYGPVMWLQLGAVNNVIIQSTKAAKEMFKNHDLIYSGRTVTEAMKACGYNERSLAIAQYGPYWRTMKRLCVTEMTVNKRINETLGLRRNSIDKMLQWIDEEARDNHGGVHVARFVFLMTFNLLANLMLSRDLLDPQSKEGPKFFTAMDGLMHGGGLPNIADFFPIFKWLDPQRIRRNMERDMGEAMEIVSGFVQERIKDQQSGTQKARKDFLDVLLEYEGQVEDEPDRLSNRDVVTLILEIFMAGSDTTSSTTEWAMTEIIRHSNVMNKVRQELADVVGPNRKMEESDIEQLPYLQAVVKETLRLHPPIPFLVPRKAEKDNNFMGYHIPKGTQVLVNAWAIGRDSDSWEDPLSFKPERFLGSAIDYKGQDFEFIPFGAGRRICAGIPLAHRVLHLAIGSLVHCFDWELDQSVSPDKLDMKERMGIVLRKHVALKAIPTKRNVFYNSNEMM